MPLCVSNYILCIQDLIFKQKYITDDYMMKASNIFIKLTSSSLVSDLYGLIQHILYLVFVAPYCINTMTLVKHCVVKKGPLYGVSYLYEVWLVSMTLFPTL